MTADLRLQFPLALILLLGGGCLDPTPGTGAGAAGGNTGSGGALGDKGGAGGSTDLECFDSFSGGIPARCCPNPPPDCRGKPDQYIAPGIVGLCVDAEPGQKSSCSCQCNREKWWCGC